MTWNEDRERLIAAAELGDATPRIAADLLVAARRRAFEAESKTQQLQTELDALKAAHAWIKTSERLPADDARVLALVLDNAGNERTEIVTVWSGPVWRYEDNGLQIDPEIITGWMPLPGRTR